MMTCVILPKFNILQFKSLPLLVARMPCIAHPSHTCPSSFLTAELPPVQDKLRDLPAAHRSAAERAFVRSIGKQFNEGTRVPQIADMLGYSLLLDLAQTCCLNASKLATEGEVAGELSVKVRC